MNIRIGARLADSDNHESLVTIIGTAWEGHLGRYFSERRKLQIRYGSIQTSLSKGLSERYQNLIGKVDRGSNVLNGG